MQETSTTIYNNVDKKNLVNEAHEAMFDLFDNTVDAMIIPVGNKSKQVLTLVTRTSKNNFEETKEEDVLFVPLLKGVVS